MTRTGESALAARAGLLSIVLGLVAVAVDRMWSFPATGASAQEVGSFVADHRTALLVAMVLTAAAVVLWLVFAAGVWLRLREATGAESVLSACFLFGFAAFVTLLLAGFTPFLVLVYRAPAAPDPSLLYDVSFGLLAMSGAPTALALCAYAALVWRDGALPRWTAWLAALAAAAHLVLLGSLLVASGFFSLEGGVTIAIPGTLFAWIAGTSVALLKSSAQERSGMPS